MYRLKVMTLGFQLPAIVLIAGTLLILLAPPVPYFGPQATSVTSSSPFSAPSSPPLSEAGGQASTGPTQMTSNVSGGSTAASTGDWVQLSPSGSVPAEFWAAMTYDPLDRNVLLYSGMQYKSNDLLEQWAYSGTPSPAWTEATWPNNPSDRVYTNMATTYDAQDGYVVMFGGLNWPPSGPSTIYGDTWSYNGATWTEREATYGTSCVSSNCHVCPDNGCPSPRNSEDVIYDPKDGYTLLFGGTVGVSGAVYGDTWTYSGGNWTNISSTAGSPPARDGAGIAYDAADGYVLMFGGVSAAGTDLRDAWTFSGGKWAEVCSTCAPPARDNMMMTYDAADGYVLLFGGETSPTGSFLSDTWEYLGGTWTQLSPATSPPARQGASITYDQADGYVLMYGGLDASQGFQDTWAYEAPAPQITSFSSSASAVDVGQRFTLSTIVSGGAHPLTYSYSSLPPGCSSADTSTLNCTPSTSGTYTPSVTVTDSFSPGRVVSQSTTVKVAADPTISTFTATPSPTDVGVPTVLSVTAVPGTGTFSYAYSGLPAGCSTSDASTLSCDPVSAGTTTVRAYANDSVGESANTTLSLRVNPDPGVSSFAASPTAVTLPSGTTTFTTSASGGTGTLLYAYAGLPPGCSSANSASLSCTPSSATGSPFTVEVTVTDSLGLRAYSNATLTVDSPTGNPTLASVSISPTSANLTYGGEQTFQASALDSLGASLLSGVSYTWALSSSSLGTLSSTTGSSVGFTASSTAQTGTLTVTGVDGGVTKSYSVDIIVSASLPALGITSFTASPTTVSVDGIVSFDVVANGGSGELSYAFSGLPPGCSTPSTATTEFSCAPSTAGTYGITVNVTDAAGQYARATVVLVVTTGAAANSGFLGGIWGTLALLIVAVLVVLLLIVVMARRRKDSRDPSPPPVGGGTAAWASPPSGGDVPTPPPDYYGGLTFDSPPQEWEEDPSQAYGEYAVSPPSPPTSAPGFPSAKIQPEAYQPWSLKLSPEGIDVERTGPSEAAPGVQDAQFVSTPSPAAPRTTQVLRPAPTPEDVYVVLYGLSQRPRTQDGIAQMVKLPDDSVTMMIQGLEKAKLVVHGTKASTGTKFYVVTPLGRKLMVRAITGETTTAAPAAALPAPAKKSVAPQPKAKPASVPSKPVEQVEMDGFRPQDVNPQAKPLPKGSYQAWSADVQGGTANIHEIGGEGAQREEAERGRIRKLLEARAEQRAKKKRGDFSTPVSDPTPNEHPPLDFYAESRGPPPGS